MELLLRVRVPSVGARPGDPASDVVVVVDPDHSLADLTEALCDHLGHPGAAVLGWRRRGRTLAPGDPVARCGVMSGDELTLGAARPGAGRPQLPARAVTADLIAGPDSGRWHLLQPGRYSVGRSPDMDLVVADPSVSRHHADLEVGPAWNTVIHPRPGTANGITLNDVAIDSPTGFIATDVLGLGGTRLAVRPFERSEHEHHDQLGQIDFHRTPYRPPVVAVRHSEPVGPIPTRPESRRLQILAVLAPLVAGIAMFAVTRQLHFLALTLVSPVVMIADSIEQRRSGRRNFGARLDTFRVGLVAQRQRFEEMRDAERVERLQAAPDLASLVRRAELRTIDLWARGRTAPDFLRLRIGLGPTTVQFPIAVEPGGDDDLRAEAIAAVDGVHGLDNMPVSIDLCHDAVTGVHGERQLVDGLVSSLVVQAATLHSPDDLTIVAAVTPGRPLGWLKWLPHLRSVVSPLSGNHLVTSQAGADALIARLIDVAGFRRLDRPGRSDERPWPHILLFLDSELMPDPAEVSRLLEIGPAAGISVVWMASRAAQVTRHATRTLALCRAVGAAMVGHLSSTDPALPGQLLEVEHLRHRLAEQTARALAPVRDASTASLATSIPRVAPLLDVLGVGNPDAAWVTQHWQRAHQNDLRFPIGIGAGGIVEIDLVGDGPHALIGGTSGSGKSEFLQSMVAALAANHPPTRLNFLFVDYKGGASSQVFERLPHTVGYVTNLSLALARRALISLRAELNRRMATMEGRAKDLAELRRVAPGEAPPSLVIVIDEFATLVNEVPEFVEGMVDIAQRGRSLGIHLVLATQRPTGAVNENILANTNIRISLRMLDRGESTAIIGSPDAADIPVPLLGRGLVRLGPRRLVEFQGAFASAPLIGDQVRQPVLVGPFVGSDDSPGRSGDRQRSTPPGSQLTALIDAVVEADRMAGCPAPRRPWREVLPAIVTLGELQAGASGPVTTIAGRHVPIGLIDDPERQDQRPGVVDLEVGGGLLVFGAGGSGKTTLLRTIAAAIEQAGQTEPVATIAFDFASRGLVGLRALPTVIDVATGDDLESVTRHLTVLDTEIERRRRILADAGAEDLTAYRRERAGLARIVVLIDGFGGLVSTLLEPSSGSDLSSQECQRWSEVITRVVVDGRQVGVHTVITADRRSAVPARLVAAVANRLILPHADEGGYADHGVSVDRAGALDQPGRALLDGITLTQLASVSADPAARSQLAAIAAIAGAGANLPTTVLASDPLPDRVQPDALRVAPDPRVGRSQVTIGVVDVSGEPAVVGLEWSNLTIAGPPRSGRSTALSVVALALRGDHDVVAIGPASSPLASLEFEHAAFGRPDQVAPVLDRLARRLADRAMSTGPARRSVLVIDDLDRFDDPLLGQLLDRVASADDLLVVAALESRSMAGYTTSAMVALMRRSRRQLVLQPDDPGEFLQMTGIKLPSRPGLRLPPGRGVLVSDRTASIVQVACLGDPTARGWSTRRPAPGVPDRPAATPVAATPSASTPESVACDRQPARR